MLQLNESMIGVSLANLQNKNAWFVSFHFNFRSYKFVFYIQFMMLLAKSVYAFDQRDDFWNEAINLADLHHPNVVAFYGVVLDGPGGSVATVTEYMVNGSLRNALQKNEGYQIHFGFLLFPFVHICLSVGKITDLKFSCI